MVNVAELNQVLQVCGVTVTVDKSRRIDNEDFTALADSSQLKGDKDVDEIAKRLLACLVGSRVNLETIQVKKLQTLVFGVRDLVKRGLGINAAGFTPAVIMEAKL